MKNSLDFNVYFNEFAYLDFINCFISSYMYLEGKKDEQEHDLYFRLFHTMCGHSSLRCRFDGEPTQMHRLIGDHETDGYSCGTDHTVDFLFGFTGYEYHKCTDTASFQDEIFASIDAGKPVIAKVESGNGRFRVITGYDDHALINPDYGNIQDKPRFTLYDELEVLYIIGNKIVPRYTLKDGLERIRQVMEHNISEKLWDECIGKMGGWIMYPSDDGLDKTDAEVRKVRMQRLKEVVCYAWNCHLFGETFRNCYYEELRNPLFTELWGKISDLCYSIDAFGHAIMYLNNSIDWSSIHFAAVPGISAMICMTIEKVRQIDIELLDTIKQAIKIAEK